MVIKRLITENFRNLLACNIEFADGVNIMTGKNAQGKTNIIEALWLFSASKSFRTNNEKEFINHDANFSTVSIDYVKNSREQSAQLHYYESKRREIFLNDIKVKPSELVGNFTTVMFFPSHLNLIKEGPDQRRKFIDFAITQIKPQYFALLSDYNKVLYQRNNALKSDDPSLLDTIEVWDIKMAKLGARINVLRKKYIKELEKYAKVFLDEISSGKETLSLIYQSVCEEESLEKIEEIILTKLYISRERDIRFGNTDFGVHKDEIEVLINGKSAKAYGSQGQQRSAVMAMKLGEAEILKAVWDEYPILLFDDVFSELDPDRKKYIGEKIRDKQVIITACEALADFKKARLFEVCGGRIKNM